jgi:hypothetical protein
MEPDFHNLLKRQLKKYLTEDWESHPQFKNFINAVNQSYQSFERDKEIMDHAFKQSEEEYQAIYINLKNENILKQKSISIFMSPSKFLILQLNIWILTTLQSCLLMFLNS